MRTIAFISLFFALSASGGGVTPEPAACGLPLLEPPLCTEGAFGRDEASQFSALAADEIDAIVTAAARSLTAETLTVAVVDRAGRPLAVFRKAAAMPGDEILAVGVARTAAFFSHDMAPLSSRTVRFVSGIHFPPGVRNAPSGALYGIENTNRGCDLNVVFNEGKCIPRARSLSGEPCHATDSSGCGPGIVTGKRLPADLSSTSVQAGGVPLYRIVPPGLDRALEGIVTNGKLVGAIGVVGAPESDLDEFAAATGAFGAPGIVPLPFYPLPKPGNVFVEGIRLPFLGPRIRLDFDRNGLPTGIRRLPGTAAGSADGEYVIAPHSGGCAPNEYLVGPLSGSRLSRDDVDGIVMRAIATARRTRGLIRLPLNSHARLVIAVADVDGSILALYRMPDATLFSVDVAAAKSRNVVHFSTAADLAGVPPGTAVTNRTIGFGAQPFFPPGIDTRNVREGPWYRSIFLPDLENPCSQGMGVPDPNRNGVVFFAGSSPLYRGGEIAGGLGVSGDGIEQDDYVAFHAAGPFLPSREIWADRVKIDGARLPMFKFPRQPEGVTECGGRSCD